MSSRLGGNGWSVPGFRLRRMGGRRRTQCDECNSGIPHQPLFSPSALDYYDYSTAGIEDFSDDATSMRMNRINGQVNCGAKCFLLLQSITTRETGKLYEPWLMPYHQHGVLVGKSSKLELNALASLRMPATSKQFRDHPESDSVQT
eukprot:CAMPEP_0175881574 /NCGR_PEP_ID=MMETSP0107_2-20121207/42946_1 /TAXON_ID=195067 ORGANISM="Goniomonas pacifica, Strain CCMP1869" /NCGR_SAMPLE_ID=MMETSP0107_2 /ASSEMBLY_ACC=CAM_ASM_000203 /LENGTH=145 /DNA_ID=CAMNT_0017201439 /DNA_START=131 /DNA_END=569 /DNA_ORIENTATION=-